MTAPERIDRRHFTTRLALGAGGLGVSLAPLSVALATDDKPVNQKTDEPAAPELPSAEVVLLTYLTRRHPSDHYDEAALQGIYRDIRGDIARGNQLSDFPLKNSDEPAFIFAAYRSQTHQEEQKGAEETK